jgi:hypothetical protein
MTEIFPIIYTGEHRFAAEVPRLRSLGLYAFLIGVPLAMLEPHGDRVRLNHGNRTLRSLAQAGGLSAGDVVAILLNRSRHNIPNSHDQPYQHRVLLEMIQEWENLEAIRNLGLNHRR